MNTRFEYQSLAQVLLSRETSRQRIDFIAGQDQSVSVSFVQMLTRAKSRLSQFQQLGLGAGDQLIIQTSDLAAFIEAFWACLLGGIVGVPVSGGNSAEHRFKLLRIANTLNNPALFTDEQNLSRIGKFAQENDKAADFKLLQNRSCLTTEPDAGLPSAMIHECSGNDTAFIQFSSGSTSTPKGIVLTHQNLLLNTEAIIEGCSMSSEDHLLSWMPLTHDMGLIGFHLTPVVCDTSHSLIATDVFVRRPMLWLQEATRLRASMLCSPNFGYQHVLKSFNADKHSGLDLSSVRYLFNGAEPISVTLCEQFMQAMTPFGLPSDAMYPVYGLAEASLAVTFPPADDRFRTLTLHRDKLALGQKIMPVADDAGITFVSVGQPVLHVQLQIQDENGASCEEDITGRICIRGGNVTAGYYNEPELNRQVISDDHWLDTGDLGFMHKRRLYITGRAKDIIFVSGQNLYPHDLEEMVFKAGIVERGKLAIASLPATDLHEEQIVAFIQHRGNPDDLRPVGKAMVGILAAEGGVKLHAISPVARIPKTTSGKVQRYALLADLKKEELPLLIQSSSSEAIAAVVEADSQSVPVDSNGNASASVAEQLLQVCNEQVEEVAVGMDDNLFELGISSLTLAQIHAAIEERWPDQVDITDLFDYPSVNELAGFLESGSAK